jgi:SAM-dependent methyltransferase
MKIAENILDILAECTTSGHVVYLPDRQLHRSAYNAVNKCLENIGGKWDRKSKGHIFDYEPAESLENLVFTGETEDMKKKFQFFPTPRPVAEIMCDLAELNTKSIILEPSCGEGNLMDVIYERPHRQLYGVELDAEKERYLSEKPYKTKAGINFLDFADENYYDRIIMNPPFARQQDIDHIRKAYRILKAGGILVSVISASWQFRTNAKSAEFRKWLSEMGAEIEALPEVAFKESGTMVRTNIIKVRKNISENAG